MSILSSGRRRKSVFFIQQLNNDIKCCLGNIFLRKYFIFKVLKDTIIVVKSNLLFKCLFNLYYSI